MKCLQVLVGLSLLAVGAVHGAKLDAQLKSGFEGLKTVLVHIKDVSEAKTALKNSVLDFAPLEKNALAASSFSESDRHDRVHLVARTLMEVHGEAQQNVLAFLNSKAQVKSTSENAEDALRVEPLWISNTIILRNVDSATVQELASHPDVESIEAETIFQLVDPVEAVSEEKQFNGKQLSGYQWGVKAVGAVPLIEQKRDGKNIVVGVIDTGVNGNHIALRDNFRSQNGWLDPKTKQDKPFDDQGHGTHCAGSILGTKNGTGVAPGSKWIACKGCQKDGCSDADLKACGQFMICPSGNTNNCQAPHIVSNSWGSGNFFGTDKSYKEVIKAWRSAGIIPVYAIGNSGQAGCQTTGNPGDDPDVFGIGASSEEGKIASFSSLGPTKQTAGSRIKPDFTAPGEDIWSAHHNNNTQLVKMSGTSMACPHAAGVMAIVMSEYLAKTGKIMTYDQMKDTLIKASERTLKQGARPYPWMRDCGGVKESTYPNNHVGYGLLNVTKAVNNLPQ